MNKRVLILLIFFFLLIGIIVIQLDKMHTENTHIAYGIDINMNQTNVSSNLDSLLTLAKQGNVSTIRIGIDWAALEPSPGVYDWTKLDILLHETHKFTFTLLFDLGLTPKWDLSSDAQGDEHYPPMDCLHNGRCNNVGTFITALVNHIGPQVYSIYLIPRNEPQDTSLNWVGGTEEAYATFVHAIYANAHATKYHVYILNGGEEIYPSILKQKILSLSLNRQQAIIFSQNLYNNPTFCNSIDILDLHVANFGPMYSTQIVDNSEKEIEKCDGGKSIPVWVTEVSFSSDQMIQMTKSYTTILGEKYTHGDASQASYLSDTYHALMQSPHVIGINWISLLDNNHSLVQSDRGIGLLNTDKTKKPAFMELELMANGLHTSLGN